MMQKRPEIFYYNEHGKTFQVKLTSWLTGEFYFYTLEGELTIFNQIHFN